MGRVNIYLGWNRNVIGMWLDIMGIIMEWHGSTWGSTINCETKPMLVSKKAQEGVFLVYKRGIDTTCFVETMGYIMKLANSICIVGSYQSDNRYHMQRWWRTCIVSSQAVGVCCPWTFCQGPDHASIMLHISQQSDTSWEYGNIHEYTQKNKKMDTYQPW